VKRKKLNMTRKITISIFILLAAGSALVAQEKQGTDFKREVTLYNPYKPTLNVIRKRSFLPDIRDTAKSKPAFSYIVTAEPLMPEYNISPIKAAALLPDPLPKLYKSYISAGLGTYLSPFGELSISNERSKKGAIGLYARHFSTNGKVKLDNDEKVFAGYMDNDASLYGKKFFKKSLLEGSVDFAAKTRYAYGYAPEITGYAPEKDDIRMKYENAGAKASFSSETLDSSDLSYDIDLAYNFFNHTKDMQLHKIALDGDFAKSIKGFYAGAGVNYEFFIPSDSVSEENEYIFSISPFVKKSSELWNFKLGFEALRDRENIMHIYPDIEFGFNIVPTYVSFFASLNGYLERNEPLKLLSENPFLADTRLFNGQPRPLLFTTPDTDHELVLTAGIKGNSGIGGSYLISASYSVIESMLFYSNVVSPDTIVPRAYGNYFIYTADNGNILNIHGELSAAISDKMTFNGAANFFSYSFSTTAWNMPQWDARAGLEYNLRDKIIAGVDLTARGSRTNVINGDFYSIKAGYAQKEIEMPAHVNMNLSAEYRYSKILSFWTRLNNIGFNQYSEWAYYPSQRFLFLLGFTYSL